MALIRLWLPAAEALKSNTSCKRLTIYGCDIGPEGAAALADALLPLFFPEQGGRQQDVSDTLLKVLACVLDFAAVTEFRATRTLVCASCSLVHCQALGSSSAGVYFDVDLSIWYAAPPSQVPCSLFDSYPSLDFLLYLQRTVYRF